MNRLFALVVFVLVAEHGFAAEVLQVKGQKVLLNISGLQVQEGSEVISASGPSGKKALIKIKQIRGEKAVGEILKGTAEAGQDLRARRPAPQPPASQFGQQEDSAGDGQEETVRRRGFFSSFQKRGTALGFIGGFNQNKLSMTVKKKSGSTVIQDDVSLSGNSFSVMAHHDFPMTTALMTRLKVGVETFSATGSSSTTSLCGGGNCTASFTYLALGGEFQYLFSKSSPKWFVSSGADFLMTASKSTSIDNLDTSGSISQFFYLGGGAHVSIDRKTMIPISIEYGNFNADSVKANSLKIRAGYSWTY